MFLLGTEMDYKIEKLSAQFVFNNPNQTAACGCGESVQIEPARGERRRRSAVNHPKPHYATVPPGCAAARCDAVWRWRGASASGSVSLMTRLRPLRLAA